NPAAPTLAPGENDEDIRMSPSKSAPGGKDTGSLDEGITLGAGAGVAKVGAGAGVEAWTETPSTDATNSGAGGRGGNALNALSPPTTRSTAPAVPVTPSGAGLNGSPSPSLREEGECTPVKQLVCVQSSSFSPGSPLKPASLEPLKKPLVPGRPRAMGAGWGGGRDPVCFSCTAPPAVSEGVAFVLRVSAFLKHHREEVGAMPGSLSAAVAFR
ncbi:unnamed protein product, partial [Discosporangium mesarthrocarpum]